METTLNFLFCQTTDSGIVIIKADVSNSIEHTEETNLCKLCDTCQEYAFDAIAIILEPCKEITIQASALLMLRCFVRMLERRIVFIYQHGYLHAALFVSPLDNSCKAIIKRNLCRPFAVYLLILRQGIVQIERKRPGVGAALVHTEMKDWTLRPLFLQVHDFQPLKEFSLSFEITLQCRSQQGLSKTARTTQKVILIAIGYFPEHIRLVHVKVIPLTQLLEILYPQRKLLPCHIHFSLN